jgi:hypothetical protein
MSVASNPSAPSDVLARLAENESMMVRMSVASNPSAPPELLVRFTKDKSEVVRMSVARNPNTPPKAFARLAKDDETVKLEVASNPRTPPDVLAQLAKGSEAVRLEVARNLSAPPKALARLAKGGEAVRLVVARNPSTPPKSLARLAKGDSAVVGALAINNPSISLASLHELAASEDKAISSAAEKAATRKSSLAEFGDVGITIEQRLALQNGKRIMLSIVREKNGAVHDKIYARFDRETNKLTLLPDTVFYMEGGELKSTTPTLTADREKAMEAAPKQPLLAKIGDVEITPEQRLALQRGERIVLSNVKDKKGTVHDTVYVTFDRKTNKLKLQQRGKVQHAKPDVKHVKPLPKKVAGLKM